MTAVTTVPEITNVPTSVQEDAMVNWETDGCGGICDTFYVNEIGMYGDTDSSPEQYYFWHSFYDAKLNDYLSKAKAADGTDLLMQNSISNGLSISMLYQMGDTSSAWEGVTITGTTEGFSVPEGLSPISQTNAGWQASTPAIPGASSTFKGYYAPRNNQFVIWRECTATATDAQIASGSYTDWTRGRVVYGKY